MAGIFIFSEDRALAAQLLTPALELKAALGEPLIALARDAAQATELSTLGPDKVLVVGDSATWIEGLGKPLAALVAEASVLLIGGTLRGKHLAADVAARLKAGMTTDAKAVRIEGGKLVATRILYAGLAVCDEELPLPAVATIRARTFLAPTAAAAHAPIEQAVAKSDARVTVNSVTSTSAAGVDITAAARLIAVGRGFRKQEDLKLAEDLGSGLGAELACTRGIAEDDHWLPIERYIGISGQTVKPELYVAVGLSGQVQHMVGCRESKTIVAINNDERSPIFEAADYGIVGDLYEVLPLLTAALRK
jgi:electron transfer flavoprotein alpha subunit